MKGVIIGKFVREYPDKTSGEMKKSRELAVVWEKKERQEDGCSGQKCDMIFVTFPIDDFQIGDYCEFEYEINNTSKGTFARLSDIKRLSRMSILFQPVNTGKPA